VEPGIFSIFSDNRRFGRENGEPNQALASQFSQQQKREFATA